MANSVLTTVTQKLLEKISLELGDRNTGIKQALANVNKAVSSTHKQKLEAEVEYKFTLEEILKDDDWDDHPGVDGIPQPPKR